MNEGLGRRRSGRDIERDIWGQREDAKKSVSRLARKTLVSDVEDIDRSGKKLTGRKPEMYARESGVPSDELFPSDGRVLNIGDPWQALDLPQVVSIEYETGEEAMFVNDPDTFAADLPVRIQDLRRDLQFAKTECPQSAPYIDKVRSMLDTIANAEISEYPKICQLLLSTLDDLKQYSTPRKLDVQNAWFRIHELMRGLDDVHLLRTVIQPEMLREHVRRKGMSDDDASTFFQRMVAEHRFLKRTKHAEFIKATFPDVPCEDASFARIIASWSVSTHTFPVLDVGDFMEYWTEISRLLSRDGVAYLWPVYHGNEWNLARSLFEHFLNGGDAAVYVQDSPVYDEDDDLSTTHHASSLVWVDDPGFEDSLSNGTLIIFPVGAPPASKRRVMDVLQGGRNDSH